MSGGGRATSPDAPAGDDDVRGEAPRGDAVTAWTDELSEQARDWYFIGLDLQADGRLAIAADLLVRASCLDAGSAPLREAAARAQFAAHHYLGSSVTFSGMLALNPRDEFALYASGLCFALMGYFDKAIDNLTDAVRRRPDVEQYANVLAVVREVSGQVEGDPVVMPSYALPPIPIAPALVALELGPRPAAVSGTR